MLSGMEAAAWFRSVLCRITLQLTDSGQLSECGISQTEETPIRLFLLLIGSSGSSGGAFW